MRDRDGMAVRICRVGLLSVILLAVFPNAGFAQGTTFRNSEFKFRFVYPNDWKSIPPRGSNTRALIQAPPGHLSNCNIVVRRMPELEKLTREQIVTESFSDVWSEDDWRHALGPKFSSAAIHDRRLIKADNYPAQFSVTDLTYETVAGQFHGITDQFVTMTPGIFWNFGCIAGGKTEEEARHNYGIMHPQFLAILSSFVFEESFADARPRTKESPASDPQVTSADSPTSSETSGPTLLTMPPNFCLADEDLRTVMVRTSIEATREMIDTCGKKYAALSEFADNTLQNFDVKFSREIDARDDAIRDVFRKSGLRESKQGEIWSAAQAEGQQVATGYSDQKCKNVISGMKVITDTGDFRLVEKMGLLDWASRRAATPRCGSPGQSSSLDKEIKAHNDKVVEETKKRCLMPKSSLSFGSNRSSTLNPLDTAIAEQEAKTAETMFDLKCQALGILRE